MNEDEKLLLSLAKAASMLGVSKDSVRRLIERGELGTVKIARRALIERQELSAFVDRHRTSA